MQHGPYEQSKCIDSTVYLCIYAINNVYNRERETELGRKTLQEREQQQQLARETSLNGWKLSTDLRRPRGGRKFLLPSRLSPQFAWE